MLCLYIVKDMCGVKILTKNLLEILYFSDVFSNVQARISLRHNLQLRGRKNVKSSSRCFIIELYAGNSHLEISVSASRLRSSIGIGIEKILFLPLLNILWKIKHLCEIHSNIPSYTCNAASVSFCYNYHFSTISYHISTKILSKMSMMEFFVDELPGLTGSFKCYLEQLFCGEQVSTCFCRNDSTGDFISGVLKRC